MPAPVVVAHCGSVEAYQVVGHIKATGHEVVAFDDPVLAYDALKQATRVKLLVTGCDIPPGKPNGTSLAHVTRSRRPNVAVIFVAPASYQPLVQGEGAFMPLSVDMPALIGNLDGVTGRLPGGSEGGHPSDD